MRLSVIRLVLVTSTFIASGCITIASSVSTPSTLEHQLLGVYEELDRDLVHLASVRSSIAAPAGSFAARRSLALDARQLQRFGEDDLAELKAAGCLAESLAARVVPRPCTTAEPARMMEARRARVARDENHARVLILDWAAHAAARSAGRAQPQDGAAEALRGTYLRLLREAAQPGHLFEVAPGRFEEIRR